MKVLELTHKGSPWQRTAATDRGEVASSSGDSLPRGGRSSVQELAHSPSQRSCRALVGVSHSVVIGHHEHTAFTFTEDFW